MFWTIFQLALIFWLPACALLCIFGGLLLFVVHQLSKIFGVSIRSGRGNIRLSTEVIDEPDYHVLLDETPRPKLVRHPAALRNEYPEDDYPFNMIDTNPTRNPLFSANITPGKGVRL